MRDDPAARLELIARTYHGPIGSAPRHLPFRRAALSFMRRQLSRAAFPQIDTAITHLRDVLGDQTYEVLARKGETMTTAAMANYAYDQIDQARTELNSVSE